MSAGWMNGRIMDESEMVLPVRDLGILRGYGVFDFLRTYKKRPFHLEDHMMRLKNSADQIGLTIPYNVEELEEAMLDLLDHCDEEEVGLRIVCTGGLSKDSLTSRAGVNLFILLEPIKTPPAEWYRNGVKVISYSHKRYRPESKSLNYIPAIEAMHEAEKHGAVEALYCDDSGQISEGTTSNIFIRKDGLWLTPGRDILKGVTRQVILNLIDPDELQTRDLYLADLDKAEEIFITSSSREILPVNQLDERFFGECPGPETRKMIQAFKEYVNSPDKWALSPEAQHGSV